MFTPSSGERDNVAAPRRVAVLLVIIVLIVFGSTLLNGFVYDDNPQILSNRWIRTLSSIGEIFTSSNWSFDNAPSNIYRPVFHLILMAEYHIFGLNPAGYHLVNLILHAGNTVMAFFVTSRLLGSLFSVNSARQGAALSDVSLSTTNGSSALSWLWPFAAALIFALHPVNVEVVSWVSAIPELSYTFLTLVAFYSFLLWFDAGVERKKSLYVISLCSFLIALFAKETAMALFVFIAAYGFVARGGRIIREWKAYVPFVAVAFFYLSVRTNAVGGIIQQRQSALTGFDLVLNVFPLLAGYFYKLLLPIKLSALYTFYPVSGVTDPRAVVSILAVAVFVALLIFSIRRRLAFISLVWIVTPLLPVLYIPALSSAAFSERYMYLSTIGFAFLFVFVFRSVYVRFSLSTSASALPVRIIAVALGALLVLYAAASVKRSFVWRSDYTLWKNTVEVSPESTNAHFNLAWTYDNAREFEKAVFHYRESIRLAPSEGADAYCNIAVILLKNSMRTEAVIELRAALAIDPGYVRALRLLSRLGEAG